MGLAPLLRSVLQVLAEGPLQVGLDDQGVREVRRWGREAVSRGSEGRDAPAARAPGGDSRAHWVALLEALDGGEEALGSRDEDAGVARGEVMEGRVAAPGHMGLVLVWA